MTTVKTVRNRHIKINYRLLILFVDAAQRAQGQPEETQIEKENPWITESPERPPPPTSLHFTPLYSTHSFIHCTVYGNAGEKLARRFWCCMSCDMRLRMGFPAAICCPYRATSATSWGVDRKQTIKPNDRLNEPKWTKTFTLPNWAHLLDAMPFAVSFFLQWEQFSFCTGNWLISWLGILTMIPTINV